MTSTVLALVALTLLIALTVGLGIFGLRLSRTTSDFYVASRSVGPGLNASAISGEYLSAASFLGVAGLVLSKGVDQLWYPVGYTAGYLLLLVFVAAPLRRSRAYTLPDFAEFRLASRAARQVASALTVLIAVLYLVPQFQGAGLTLRTLTGAPTWVGATVVTAVVLSNVVAGGMRSITLVQAVQYWIKLVALLTPLAFLLVRARHATGASTALHARDWVEPMQGPHSLYLVYSLILATFLGTMGLPHVAVRFYTNRDGPSARRTTVRVLALLGVFYLVPPVYGVLGRRFLPALAGTDRADSVVLELPHQVLGGAGGDLLTSLLGAGAFAAFLSTSSGLVVSIAGVVGQDLLQRRLEPVAAFRVAGVGGALVTLALALASQGLGVAHAVELAFAVAASTFAPLLLLGIWWRGLTSVGAVAGLVAGGAVSTAAVLATTLGAAPSGMAGALLEQPAAITVPLAFLTMIGVSVATPSRRPPELGRILLRLHAPEELQRDRDLLPLDR